MAEKKKLMLISPMLHQGGFERVCVATARLLAPYFDVCIVIFDSADIAYDIEGLKVIDIHMGVQEGKINKLFNIIRRYRKVRKLKKELGIHIAYSFGPTANIVNALSKTKKEKVWLGLRSYGDLEETARMKLFLKKADLIICCSREMKHRLEMMYKYSDAVALYNPFDAERIRKEAEAAEPDLPFGEMHENGKKIRCLFSMGREDSVKGFWHMIKAFSIVNKKIPESRLVIMGEGSFESYRRLARELEISEAVVFPGMQKAPYPYLKKGEIYLLTSKLEGFPNALVEGMALGMAAVSVNCLTGPAEILTENGLAGQIEEFFGDKKEKQETEILFGEYGIMLPTMPCEEDFDALHIIEDEKKLADVLLMLLENDELLKEYQDKAKQRAQTFTDRKYVEKILALAELDE